MALKIDAKFEGKLTIAFKNGMRSLANFHQSTRKSQNCNLQKSYVSWQWRMMHNLKKNWLASSKLTWRIWRILTLALKNLKNLHFNGLFLIKVYNVWAKKVQRSYVSWQRRLMQYWKKHWLCFRKWHWQISTGWE